MSHSKERTQTNCLNCNTTVQGRFCHICGQENVEVKYGFWTILRHFIYDIFHFDGKFLGTFVSLIKNPGKVAKNYSNGRKVAYLDPIRMYLFISAIVFVLLPIFTSVQKTIRGIHIIASPTERLTEAYKNLTLVQADTGNLKAWRSLDLLLDTSVHLRLKKRGEVKDTTYAIDFVIDGKFFKAVPIKDEALFTKGNWLQTKIASSANSKFEEHGSDFNLFMVQQAQSQQKLMPYILFLSLPLFTMLLTLLYRKKTYLHYSDHAAFTLYHYILVFGLLGFALIFQLLLKVVGVNSNLIFQPIILITSIHLVFELKSFYADGWIKTIVKFLLLIFGIGILIALLFFMLTVLTLMF